MPNQSTVHLSAVVRFYHRITLTEEEQFSVRPPWHGAGLATAVGLRIEQGYTSGRRKEEAEPVSPLEGNPLQKMNQSLTRLVLAQVVHEDGHVSEFNLDVRNLPEEQQATAEALFARYPLPQEAVVSFR